MHLISIEKPHKPTPVAQTLYYLIIFTTIIDIISQAYPTAQSNCMKMLNRHAFILIHTLTSHYPPQQISLP